MRRLARPLVTTMVKLATAALAVTLLPAPSAQAAGPVVLDPRGFPRGPDVAVPHVEGTTVVDGSLRLEVPGVDRVLYLGKAGTGYVVGTSTASGGKRRIVRVEANGAVGRLGKGDPYSARLSSDGLSVLTTRVRPRARAEITVRSALDGSVLARRTFAGYPAPLDARGSTVLLAGHGQRGTQAWDTATGTVTRQTRRVGTLADYRLDLLASWTGDPYDGGCTVVSRLSSPSTTLWRSCEETVRAFSTDGSRMATVDLLSDGIGAGRVWARTITGTRLATYDAVRDGYVGELRFESPTALLVEANQRRRGAVLRCVATTCERASGYSRVPYRQGA